MTLDDRLVSCFSAVFPLLTREQILTAQRDHIEQWDSLANLTLFTVVQEEFGITLDLAALDSLSSYQAIAQAIAPQSTETA